MIAFIEGGMTIPMGRITRDYLIAHRLCPHQCAPNMFRILGCIDALNEHLQLGLTWHDVVHMYEFHSQSDGGYYLKSRSAVVRLISCLPKSKKRDERRLPHRLRAMARRSSLSSSGERAKWGTLELGSLEKYFKPYHFHYIIIIHYLTSFQ